jgi:hypothetical protein
MAVVTLVAAAIAGCGEPSREETLVVSPLLLEFSADEGWLDVSVEGVEWTAQSADEWIEVAADLEAGTLTVAVAANEGAARIGSVVVYGSDAMEGSGVVRSGEGYGTGGGGDGIGSGGTRGEGDGTGEVGSYKTVVVRQQAGRAVTPIDLLTVAPSSLSFTAAGGFKNVTVGSMAAWWFECSEGWIEVTPMADDGRSRVATSEGGNRAGVSEDGDSAGVSAIGYASASGSGSYGVVVSVAANDGTESRTGTIAFDNGSDRRTVTVTQAGRDEDAEPDPVDALVGTYRATAYYTIGWLDPRTFQVEYKVEATKVDARTLEFSNFFGLETAAQNDPGLAYVTVFNDSVTAVFDAADGTLTIPPATKFKIVGYGGHQDMTVVVAPYRHPTDHEANRDTPLPAYTVGLNDGERISISFEDPESGDFLGVGKKGSFDLVCESLVPVVSVAMYTGLELTKVD